MMHNEIGKNFLCQKKNPVKNAVERRIFLLREYFMDEKKKLLVLKKKEKCMKRFYSTLFTRLWSKFL